MKQCIVDNCKYQAFGKGYCKLHQYLRTDIKKYINKYSERQILKLELKKELIKQDELFYISIWNTTPHRCYETNEYLGEKAYNWMFHHILPKAKYPEYRHEAWNIVLVSLSTHSKVEANIDFTPKIKELTNKLKLEHETNKHKMAQRYKDL